MRSEMTASTISSSEQTWFFLDGKERSLQLSFKANNTFDYVVLVPLFFLYCHHIGQIGRRKINKYFP